MDDPKIMTPRQAAIYMIAVAVSFLIALALMVILWSCGCPRIAHRNMVPEYPVDRSACTFTPMGACLITNNNIVSDNFYLVVDDKINETESCLKEWYATKPDVLHRAYNWKPPARSCYMILLVDDWTTSCDGEWQLFGSAPQESCNAKGFKEDPNCPCKFRGLLQDGKVILVPPDLKFLRIEIVEWLTGYRQLGPLGYTRPCKVRRILTATMTIRGKIFRWTVIILIYGALLLAGMLMMFIFAGCRPIILDYGRGVEVQYKVVETEKGK